MKTGMLFIAYKESFRGMLERGVYKEELFCDIK